jgi:hypothetical protein
MTALDGNPLTGDDLTMAAVRAAVSPRPTPRPVPVIHEPCGVGQCGGCSSRGCVTRRPGPVPVELAPSRWYDGDHIDGNQS